MFKNYFTVAWRNLLKNKVFSFINITGLAIGLSCFLMITVYVLDELSYDKYHEKASRIYRINSDIRFGGTDLHLPVTSDMMGATLKKDYPQVEEFVRIYASSGSKLIKKGNEFINEPAVAHADSTLFNVFSFDVIQGDKNTALNEPNTVVITETAAEKYFGTKDALGKTLETNDNISTLYKVTAVIKEIPRNSHFNADFIFSMDNVNYGWGNYLSHNFHTYLLFKEGTDLTAFNKNIDQYITDYIMPQAKALMNINSLEDFKKAGNSLVYSLIPITDIHLYSDRSFELSSSGNIQYVYIFSAVAFFILAIACINFMNLTTARSAGRAKEVGIRKVLGTERKQLIAQFLSESTLMAVISLVIAVIITYIMIPVFSEVSGKRMSFDVLFSPDILPLILLLPIVVGVLAGIYPAFYLSGFKPIQVLKGRLSFKAKGGSLRSALVIFQFATSIILMISTFVIYNQLNFIQTKNLGFNKEQVLIINDAYVLENKSDAFKNELLSYPGVVSGSFSGFLPVTNSSRNDNSYSKDPVMDVANGFNMQTWRVDDQYIKTMGMQIVKGRNFSPEFPSDSNAVIINETTEKLLGYENPVGEKIYTTDGKDNEVISYNIIGVVKNFNYETLKQNVGPLCMRLRPSTSLASFKITGNNIPDIIKHAETTWKSMASGMPFSYRFLDDSFDEMYRAEQRVGKIAMIFSLLAIFIACLGLFGLAAFVAEQRTKEIGIRKVLGARVEGIVQLLSVDFIKLVVIAFIIAAPVAWWFMNSWLNDFAYRVQIHWWIFLLAAVTSFLIAFLTISYQAVKAATANPVKNLRTE